MNVLDHLAQAAAVILLVELLVVLLIFAAVAGGLAFGLRWVRGKTDWAFDKANAYIPLAQRYVHTGTDYVAKPIITASGLAETVKGTAGAIKSRVQSERTPRTAPPVVAPVVEAPAVEEVTEVIPPAGGSTQAIEPVEPALDETAVVPTVESTTTPAP